MELSRDELIEWCALLTGDSKRYFEKMDDEKLIQLYNRELNIVSDTINNMTK